MKRAVRFCPVLLRANANPTTRGTNRRPFYNASLKPPFLEKNNWNLGGGTRDGEGRDSRTTVETEEEKERRGRKDTWFILYRYFMTLDPSERDGRTCIEF